MDSLIEGIEFINLKTYVKNTGHWPAENDELYDFYLEVRKDFFNTNGSPFEKNFFELFCWMGELPNSKEWEKCNSEEKLKIYQSFKTKNQREITKEDNPMIYDWVFQKRQLAVKNPNQNTLFLKLTELEKFVQDNQRWPNQSEPLYSSYKNIRQFSFEYEINENTQRFFNLFYHLGCLPTEDEWAWCEKNIKKDIVLSYVKKFKVLPSSSKHIKIYSWFHNIKSRGKQNLLKKDDKDYLQSINDVLQAKKEIKYKFVVSEKPKPSETKSTQTMSGKVVKHSSIKDDFHLTCEVIKTSIRKYQKIPEIFKPWYQEQLKKHCNFELEINQIEYLKEIKKYFYKFLTLKTIQNRVRHTINIVH